MKNSSDQRTCNISPGNVVLGSIQLALRQRIGAGAVALRQRSNTRLIERPHRRSTVQAGLIATVSMRPFRGLPNLVRNAVQLNASQHSGAGHRNDDKNPHGSSPSPVRSLDWPLQPLQRRQYKWTGTIHSH